MGGSFARWVRIFWRAEDLIVYTLGGAAMERAAAR